MADGGAGGAFLGASALPVTVTVSAPASAGAVEAPLGHVVAAGDVAVGGEVTVGETVTAHAVESVAVAIHHDCLLSLRQAPFKAIRPQPSLPRGRSSSVNRVPRERAVSGS